MSAVHVEGPGDKAEGLPQLEELTLHLQTFIKAKVMQQRAESTKDFSFSST